LSKGAIGKAGTTVALGLAKITRKAKSLAPNKTNTIRKLENHV
jgi:hypothetical protein